MPFARNESTRFISPTKTPEYLAAGRPVVSTPIRDVVRPYGEMGLVEIAEDPESFVAAAERAMARHGEGGTARGVAAAGGRAPRPRVLEPHLCRQMSDLIDGAVSRRRDPSGSDGATLRRRFDRGFKLARGGWTAQCASWDSELLERSRFDVRLLDRGCRICRQRARRAAGARFGARKFSWWTAVRTSAATPLTITTTRGSWSTSTARTSSTPTRGRSSNTCRASPAGAPTSTGCWPASTGSWCPSRSTSTPSTSSTA